MKKLILAQIEITSDLEKNLFKIQEIIQNFPESFIFFPELALTGYQNFQEFPMEIIPSLLRELQKKIPWETQIFLGCPIKRKNQILNTYLILTSEKVEIVAEKELLFPELDIKNFISPGAFRKPFFLDQTLWLPLICFELRSPEFVRSYLKTGLDGVIVAAQWPKVRIEHFKILLKSRAIENQIFALGINGVGKIGDLLLGGNSLVVTPLGEIIAAGEEEETILEIPLDTIKDISSLPYPLKTPYPPIAKVKSLEEVAQISQKLRKKGQIMVFTNGCFDILHIGHISYLQKARKLGDFLVIGVNSDNSIKKIKGPKRPINPEEYRLEVLASLSCVDYLIPFEEETPEILIRTLKPDILVKGADWPENLIVGAPFVKSYGGKVIRLPLDHKISTTEIIEKIKKEN